MADNYKPFKIAHLSDLHLTARDGASRSEPDLFTPLKGMNFAFRTIIGSQDVKTSDLVLITGDVADRGELESWKLFRDALNKANVTDRGTG